MTPRSLAVRATAALTWCTIAASLAAVPFRHSPNRVRVVPCALQETWKGEVVAESSRNYEPTRVTDGGKYRVSIKPPDGKVPMQRMHSWVLHLEDSKGAAIDSATICIDGGMPEHGHGLPTRPAVTEALHNGDFRVDGMKFSMGGWWVVKFTIDAPPGPDSIRFNLKLP
jgi:YtkA-like protein